MWSMPGRPPQTTHAPAVPSPSRFVYPNPSSQTTWTDALGRCWTRHASAVRGLHPKRVRTLLRRDDVPLVVWHAGEVAWYVGAHDKQGAAGNARAAAAADTQGDVTPSEWRAEDGAILLMLERDC